MIVASLPAATRDAIGRQDAAAVARDEVGLRSASEALVATAWRPPTPGVPVRGAELYDRLVGSMLLADKGRMVAAAMLSAARRQVGGDQLALVSIPVEAWRIDELPLLAELRILGCDWRGLPGMPGRPDMMVFGPVGRRRLRHAHSLLEAFEDRDAQAIGKAIAAIGRDDPSGWSVLAYALYREALTLGLSVTVPRRYAF